MLAAVLCTCSSVIVVAQAPTNRELASAEVERRVESLLRQMTLEEKLGQLVQYNGDGYKSSTGAQQAAALAANPEANYRVNSMELAAAGRLGSMLNVTGAERTAAF